MKPETYNIPYYRGDTFTIIVFPKDASGAPLPLGELEANHPYFRLANRRGSNPEWHSVGGADIMQLVAGGDWCIRCDISGELGKDILNGYVYDIGYHIGSLSFDRITVLTGSFLVMDEVDEIDMY